MLRTRILKMCDVLAWFHLVIGSIGSFILAYHFGHDTKLYCDISRKTSELETYTIVTRNWGLTALIFVMTLLTVLVTSAILFSLHNILLSVDYMEKKGIAEEEDVIKNTEPTVVVADENKS